MRDWDDARVFGGECEQRWTRLIARDGYAVFPFSSADHNVSRLVGAPLILMPDGSSAAAPDLFLAGVNKTSQLHEVKGKSAPSWRRVPFPGRWEHGIDWRSGEDYRAVQEKTGLPVVLVVYEDRTPADADDFSALRAADYWLTIPLDRALELGEHRRDWPGGAKSPGRRGRQGEGGLLWARAEMNLYVGAPV